MCTGSLGIEAPERQKPAPKSLDPSAPGPRVVDSNQGPIWQLDVRALGYVPPQGPREGFALLQPIGPICFLENGQILVTFVTREAPAGLARREQPDEVLPFRIRALFIDSRTGQVRTTREWPTASEMARVAPAPGGKFVVITPGRLILYSPGLERLTDLDLPIDREGLRDVWRVKRSPRGKYLLIEYAPMTYEGRLEADWVIDTENLQVVRTWTTSGGVFLDSISDHGMIVLTDGKIGRLGGPFNWLCDARETYCRGGTFLDNCTILAKDAPISVKWVYFVSPDGQLLFSEKYPEGDLFREACSADGRRLAVAAYKAKGGIALLDISPHYILRRVMVYDIPSRRWIYTLDAKKQKIKLDPELPRRELALSPDGSLLGLITEEGVLKVYRVPESAIAPSSTH